MKADETHLVERLVYCAEKLFFFYGDCLDEAISESDARMAAIFARKEERALAVLTMVRQKAAKTQVLTVVRDDA